jgi:hypothetical protein
MNDAKLSRFCSVRLDLEHRSPKSPVVILNLADADSEGRRKRTKRIADIRNGSRPKPGEICSSALTAALVLTYSRKLIAARDLVELLVTFLLSSKDEIIPFLPDIHESKTNSSHFHSFGKLLIALGELNVSTSYQSSKNIPPVLYTTMQPEHVIPSFKRSLSTKTLRFPGKLPTVPQSFLDMDMRKPHGKLPNTKRKFALWGSFYENSQNWSAVGVIADLDMLKTLDHNLSITLKTHNADLMELAIHWNQIFSYIYAIGINDVRLSLRATMRQLELLVLSHKSIIVHVHLGIDQWTEILQYSSAHDNFCQRLCYVFEPFRLS